MLYPDFNDLVALKARKGKLLPQARRSIKSSISGNHHSPFKGYGLEFDSVREYVPGDDIRNIDWRVTARTGRPHLKVFKEDRERQIILCVDMNTSMRFGTKNTFKSVKAAYIAALLGWQGIAQYDRISAYLFGDVLNGIQFFPPQRTRKAFCTILKTLTKPPVEKHSITLEETLLKVSQTAHTGSLIYIISDFMSIKDNIKQNVNLSRLSKTCDLIFIAVNDQADRELFPAGMLGFCNSDQDKFYVDTENSAGRESYAAQWHKNRELLDDITSKYKIPLFELTTEMERL